MPYNNLPLHAFWRSCRETTEFRISDIYSPKFLLPPAVRIATAGSCFAQNIGRYIRDSEFEFLDVEPAPKRMPSNVASNYGYGLYSARYGNIYSALQLRQLLSDAVSGEVHDCAIWTREGRFYDALRPSCESEGFATREELVVHRVDHLRRVRQLISRAEVFIFTLGLTETWIDRDTRVVFPTAPGVVAGAYEPDRHQFVNQTTVDTIRDLSQAIGAMRGLSPDLRAILTVSPVPLTVTASGSHVLQATTHSKAVLRAAAGELSATDPLTDYFPSYEIITGTAFAGLFYDDNLRTVTTEGVQTVMNLFFAAHGSTSSITSGFKKPVEEVGADETEDGVNCEEALLEVFSQR